MPRPLHVLIIDDDPDDTDFLVSAFCKYAAVTRFTTCQNGQEAIDCIQEARETGVCPDLAFLDLHMPGKSGLQTLTELRALPACRDFPIMVISTSLLAAEAERCREAGCTDYFIKPASLEGYDAIVAAAVGHLAERHAADS